MQKIQIKIELDDEYSLSYSESDNSFTLDGGIGGEIELGKAGDARELILALQEGYDRIAKLMQWAVAPSNVASQPKPPRPGYMPGDQADPEQPH